LKLKCDILLSTSAFKFNLCRYDMAAAAAEAGGAMAPGGRDFTAAAKAGRCRFWG
jgi:hypothetical protein